jgi:membrane-bound metal-dependent hydrolase YbcI (DUF457 family)
MQTYTHGLGAIAAAGAMLPQQPFAQLGLIFGSVMPDVPLILAYANDLFIRKRPPLVEQSQTLVTSKEATHSISVWGPLLIMTLPFWWIAQSDPPEAKAMKIILCFILGVLSHIWIDIHTHCGDQEEFVKHDCGYLWPFGRISLKWRKRLGIWEYRANTGGLKPQKPEAIIDAALISIIFYQMIQGAFIFKF